jgi:hypothetical protein
LGERDSINHFFITRFKPGEKYQFVLSCCNEFDIMLADEAEIYMNGLHSDAEIYRNGDHSGKKEIWDSLRTKYADRVGIKIKKDKRELNKNLIARFAEDSGFPYAIVLKNDSGKEMHYPQKGYFSSNITYLSFGELISEDHLNLADTASFIEDVFYDHIKVSVSIGYRFFHDENLELEYDPRTKKIKIKIID